MPSEGLRQLIFRFQPIGFPIAVKRNEVWLKDA